MKNQGNNAKPALAAAVAANTIWGFSFMATSIALKSTSVAMLLSVRFILSFALMLAVVLAGKASVSIKNKPVGLFLLMGLCEPVIYFIAETYGIKYTTSSFSGLTLSLIPITTAVLSSVFLKEQLSPKRLAWIACSVAGVILISVNQTSGGVISGKGVLFLLTAMIAASFFSILSRSISGSFTSFERTFIMMLMGCVCFTGLAVFEEGRGYVPEFLAVIQNSSLLIPLLFLSAVCSVTAFFCLNYAMTYLEVSKVVVFTNITPVVSVLAGVLLLGEPFSPIYLAGMVMILAGLYMVNRLQ